MSHTPAPLAAASLLAALLFASPAAFGQDEGAGSDGPDRAFLQGLRDRGLGDFALLELDRLAADPNAPADLKAALPYERALSLLALARTEGGAAARTRLDEAAALLEDFADENPDSPLAGDAQFLRAEILQRAAADLLGAGDPAALPDETKTQARRLLQDAERVYQSARRKLEATLREIGPFVDQRDDAGRARRNAAESRLIRARVEAARVVFLRATTYPVGDAERNKLLDEADGPLEELKNDFRRKVGALPGQIIRGQIRTARVPDDPAAVAALSDADRAEAVKQLTTAAAIFEEVVAQEPPDGANSTLRRAIEQLRGTAQRLRLGVLNHPLKADYDTVITQATEWLDGDRARAGTDAGAGVLFERGLAHERKAGTAEAGAGGEGVDRDRELRAALADFQTAARRSDALRGPATLAADRVRQALGLTREEPRTFADAFDAGQTLIRQLGEKQEAVAKAEAGGDADALAAAREELDAHLAETARLLTIAGNLADAGTDPGELSRARYLLAYVNVQLGRYYEAAVLAEDVARNFTPPPPAPPSSLDENRPDAPDQSGIPLEAASTAALAWTNAYQNRPAGTDGSFELRQLGAIADFIAEKFPDSDRASAARITLGRVLLGDGALEDAAEVFASVPENDPGFADAQLKAGDALWRRSVEVANMPQPPPGADAEALKQRARERLRVGVDRSEATLSENSEPSTQLIVGKVTLAQILNGEGEFQAAADLLTGGKAKVSDAIAAEGDRPARGLKSPAFAGLALQQLLRAQIGLKALDDAKGTIARIQKVGTDGNIGVFVSLGRQIQAELDALPAGPERDAARENLVEFLDQIAGSEEQNFGSLMWVAETYGKLAEGLPAGNRDAPGYFAKSAAALQTVLKSLGTDGFLADGTDRAAVENAVRLRLGEVLAGAGRFGEGYEEVKAVIAANPKALNAQTTAADLLADWGAATGDAGKLVAALRGEEPVWGWGKLAKMLAAQLIGPNAERFRADYDAARLRIPRIRQALAETRTGGERTAEYAKAEQELLGWLTLSDPAKIDPDALRGAETLYAELQRARGVADPEPLPEIGAPAPRVAANAPGTGDAAAPAAAAQTAAVEEEDGGPSIPLLIGGLVLFSLATAGAIFAFRPKQRKRAARRTPAAGKTGAADGGAKRLKSRRGSVRDSLPDQAPVPAAAPVAAAAGPTGTGFPDFSNLPQKKPAKTAAGTAPRTRAGSEVGGPRSAGTRSSAARSSKAAAASGSAADGAKPRRSSSGSSSSGSSSSGSSSSGESARRRRPKPPAE